MSDYVVLTFAPERPDRAAQMRRDLERAGWRTSHESPGLSVLTSGARSLPLQVSPDQDALLLGDYFGTVALDGADPARTCTRLLSQGWGRYVAVFLCPAGGLRAVFRDPSSTVEAVVWRSDAVTMVASEFPPALAAWAKDLAIDWRRVGASLVDPLVLSGHCAITGLQSVTPGALRSFEAGQEGEVLLWRPAAFARARRADSVQAREELVAVVDHCIDKLSGLGGPIIAEMSGGLDSSIVCSALARAPFAKVIQWLHYFIDDPAGDERRYALATAAHLGVTLTQARKPPGRVDHQAIGDYAFGAKPTWRVVDGGYDRDLTDRVLATRATQIMTGLGGDTVFMQGGDPWLGADIIAAGDWTRLIEAARHAQRSVWTIARHALAEAFGFQPPLAPPAPAWLTAAARTATADTTPHPWLADLDGVTVPKRQQILGLAHTLLIHGRSRRTSVADVASPLMSQPIMELCLSLSATAQTAAGDDRALARSAFAARLAPEIRARRSKAGYGLFYGQMIAQDLRRLRDLLLEGELVGAGLVDPVELDAVLSADRLIHHGPYREILNLVILEHWARSWRRVHGAVRRGGVDRNQRLVEEA